MEVAANQNGSRVETFEQFMGSMRELVESHSRAMEEISRRTEKINRENDLKAEKNRLEFERINKLVGDLSNSFGELAEHLVTPGVLKKFNDIGFKVEKTSKNIKIMKPDLSKLLTEIDILLENGEIAIVVEVKAKFRDKYLEEFLNKMKIIREYADRKQDKRVFLGAIASPVIDDIQCKNILNEGIYVIVQSGDTMQIISPEGFKPREW